MKKIIVPKPDKTGIDKQMWNVGLLAITMSVSFAGSSAKNKLAKEKSLLINVKEIMSSGQIGSQKLALKTMMGLWGEDYVRTAIEYVRLLSVKLTGEDYAVTLGKIVVPTQKEINEPKERLFSRSIERALSIRIKQNNKEVDK